MKNWIGNKKTTFSTLGASNHSEYERAENDFYATDPVVIDDLYKVWDDVELGNVIWEPACGNGHLSKRLKHFFGDNFVYSSDIIQREYKLDKQIDFLKITKKEAPIFNTIITNPPYRYALEFVQHSLELCDVENTVAMFLKITFLEGLKRRKFFDKSPPKYVLVFSRRIQVARNGDLEMFKKSSAACYAWFIWEKGCGDETIVRWI